MTDETDTISHNKSADRRKLYLPARINRAVLAVIADNPQRGFLWFPVLIAVGIALYFSVASEPGWSLCLIAMSVTLLAALYLRHGRLFWLAALTFGLALGFSAAKLRTITMAGTPLAQRIGPVEITGWLKRIETRAAGRKRLIIQPVRFGKARPPAGLETLRVNTRHLPAAITPGHSVKLTAVLMPLPGPVRPRGFDFARYLFFQNLNAVGFALSKPQLVLLDYAPPPGIALSGFISRIRIAISNRVAEAAPGQAGALVAALLVGDRSRLTNQTVAHLRAAGLAHLLAISGLHMAIFAGTLFWLVCALLALNERFAVAWNIRKIAAVTALVGGAVYYLLSGSAVSTTRAFIMFAIIAAAIVADRPAITMRNTALAAVIILLTIPESLLSPGFQMSFATVIGLVAYYEHRTRSRRATQRPPGLPGSRILLYFTAISVATVIATLATGPIAAHHFGRIATYGLAANLVAIPLTALWLMPAGLATLLSLSLGLEHYALIPAIAAAKGLLLVGDWVAAWPRAEIAVAKLPLLALMLAVGGGLWVCLWRTAIRWAGLVLVALAMPASQLLTDKPDILIARDGRNIAVRGQNGALAIADGRAARFSARAWLRADGDRVSLKQAAARRALSCDKAGCTARVKGKRLAFIRHPSALRDACSGLLKADIVITAIPAGTVCKSQSLLVTPADLKRHGAQAIYIKASGIVVKTVNDRRGHRPWTATARRRARSGTR
jgi:competence protein ComEC